MKVLLFTFFLSGFLLIGCSEKKESTDSTQSTNLFLELPEILTEKSVLKLNPENSLWTFQNQLYSGYAVSYYTDGSLKEKFGVLNGAKQNKFIQWYPDGHLKNETHYHQGKFHGDKKVWSTDTAHTLIAHYQFHTGKAHGEQKKWYPTGELYKILHMSRGKEEGMQQAFRKNGDLYANYEARAGRIFGLKKAALCFSLEDQKVKTNE